MNKPKIDKIYLDMDGVVADFETRYRQLFGLNPNKAEKDKKFDGNFTEFIADNNFATLDMMPRSGYLISFLASLSIPTEILSSTANEKRHAEISRQKSVWLTTHGIRFKENFVPGKHLKYKFATPNSILIDDTQSNIDDWNKAGGIGILHKDVDTTLNILRMYI
jgi:hypothetical protein